MDSRGPPRSRRVGRSEQRRRRPAARDQRNARHDLTQSITAWQTSDRSSAPMPSKANGSDCVMNMPMSRLTGSTQKRVFHEPAQSYVPSELASADADGSTLTPTPRP